MGDNIAVTPGSGALVATRTLIVQGNSGIEVPYGILGYESSGVLVPIDATHGLPVHFVDASIAVTGTFWPATQPISAAALPLPSGAATSANQATGNTSLAAIAAALGGTITVGGSVSVANFPGTQPVSGTVTANAGSGTFAVSAASLPLPAGAATSARQPAIGTAGSASADVLTIQGIASMTAVKVDGSAVTQPVSGTVAANQGGNWSVRTQDGTGNALTSIATGSQRPLTVAVVDASGNQITSFGGAGSGGGTSSNFGSADPAAGTAAGFSDGSNMREARVFDLDSGAGTQYCVGVGLRLSASGGSVEAGTSSNPLRFDPTGTTAQPVTGTFWQATQPVSGTVTANAGSGTFAVSAASLPLPSGASTAAKQPALGTAGSASADVLTVQGIASMTALKVDGSGVTQPVSGTFWQATQPISGTVTANQGGSNWSANVAQVAGTTTDTNSGNKSAGTLRVVIATDQPALTNALRVDGSAVTQPVSGTFWQSTQPVSLASLPALAAGTASIGTVQPGNTANTTPWLVTQTPATSGGCSIATGISSGAANQDATSIKSSAGQLYGYAFFNTTSSARYAKLYNASAPTSSSTPILVAYLPPTGGANVDIPGGIACGTAIGIRLTTGSANNDTGACSTGDVIWNVWYK